MGNGFLPLVPVEDLPEDLHAPVGGHEPPRATRLHPPDGAGPRPTTSGAFNEANSFVRFGNHLGPARHRARAARDGAKTTRCQVSLAGRSPAALDAGLTEDMVDDIGREAPVAMTGAEHAAVRFTLKFGTDHLSITEDDKAALRAPALFARADRRARVVLRAVHGGPLLDASRASRSSGAPV